MAQSLPASAVVCNATAQVQFGAGASWSSVGQPGTGAMQTLILTAGRSVESADMAGLVAASVTNTSAADPVFFTFVDPGVGVDPTVGHRVEAGASLVVSLYGTNTTPRLWVWGAAAAPTVVVAVALTERA